MAFIDAEYFHASLYSFDTEAKREIIATFNATVQDVSARCWYDVELDMFCVACAPENGHRAEASLQQIVSAYVEQELAAVEREDRACKVRRFAKSSCDDGIASDMPSPHIQESESQSYSSEQKSDCGPVIMHSVASEQFASGSIKFLSPLELPDSIVNRMLTPSKGFQGIMNNACMPCAVRWNEKANEYIFNGRYGAPILGDAVSHSEFFSFSTFTALTDQRQLDDKGEAPDPQIAIQPVKEWTFDGRTPDVRQFLEGMGDIVPAAPEEAREIPADAKKFLAKADYQIAAGGRVRVPQGGAFLLDDSCDVDDADESISSPSGFANLLAKNRSNCDDNDFDHGSQDEESSESGDRNITFQKLISKKSYDLPAPQDTIARSPVLSNVENSSNSCVSTSTVRDDRTPTPASLAPVSSAPVSTTQISASVAKDSPYTNHNDNFPDYSNRFAKVDRIGLTSNPGNAAQWHLENRSPPKPKHSRRGIIHRDTAQHLQPLSPQVTSGGSVAMSLSTGPELHRMQHPSPPTSYSHSELETPTIRSYADAMHKPETWSNVVLKGNGPTGRLIDDTAPADPMKVRLPPGLGLPPGLNSESKPSAQNAASMARRGNNNNDVVNISATPNLIDISEDEVPTGQPKVRLPDRAFMKPLHASSDRQQVLRNSKAGQDDEGVVERIRPVDDEQVVKKSTMRQKAGKKAKGKQKAKANGSFGKFKVVLPTPDPVPPPKAASSSKQKAANELPPSDQAFPEVAADTADPLNTRDLMDSPMVMVTDDEFQVFPPPLRIVAKFLHRLKAGKDVSGMQLRLRFGTVFITSRIIIDTWKGVMTPQQAEKMLEDLAIPPATQLIPRLTASENEAYYIANLIDGEMEDGGTEYELHFRDVDNNLRVIKQSFCNGVWETQVKLPDTLLGACSIYYPLNVWSCEASVSRQNVDDDYDWNTFADKVTSTMQTIGCEPSFEAWTGDFGPRPEQVYHMRHHTKRIKDGVQLRLTAVTHLDIQPPRSGLYTFSAISYGKQRMAELQRAWIEAEIQVDSADGVDDAAAEELQDLVDRMITEMDGVGYHNVGPWVKNQDRRMNASNDGSTEIPFW